MDTKDFTGTGIAYDDLVEAYVQTVLAVTAIDKMAGNLMTKQGKLKKKLFLSLNRDNALWDEIKG